MRRINNMELYTDKAYIQNSLACLGYEIKDLEEISVHNNDFCADEIYGLITRYQDIKQKMEGWMDEEVTKPGIIISTDGEEK